MTRTFLTATLSLILFACGRAPDLKAQAQTNFNQQLGGMACTSLTRIRFVNDVDRLSDEYAKISILEKHGAVSVERHKTATGIAVTDVRPVQSVKEGKWESNGNINYYCFGKWTITEAAIDKSPPFSVEPGKQAVKVTYILTDAPDWLTAPESQVLAKASRENDLAARYTLTSLNTAAPASYSEGNTGYVLLGKE